MSDARLRAIIREEIALAMKTLARVADDASTHYAQADDRQGEADGSYALASAAGTYFESAYEADTAVADEERERDAANPFAEPEGEAVAVEVKALVRAEVLDTLRELSTTFSMSGLDDDLRISDRLDHVVRSRESAGE